MNNQKQKFGNWIWALALVGIIFIVAGTFLNKFLSIPEETGKILNDIFQPRLCLSLIYPKTVFL